MSPTQRYDIIICGVIHSMDKIKSSLELAMERTANLSKPDPSAKHEQYLQAARTLARAYLEGRANLERILESVSRYPREAQSGAVRSFLEELLKGAAPDNCYRLAEAFRRMQETYGLGPGPELLLDFNRRYREQLKAERARLLQDRAALLATLREAGISGSAVAGVNLDRHPLWKETLRRLHEKLSTELEELKAKLHQSLQEKSP